MSKPDLSQMPEVTDAASAERFLRWACRSIGAGFHPDTPCAGYVEADGSRTFTDEEARLLDDQVTAAFEFVADPYSVCLDEFQAMRAGPTPPKAGAGPVEGTTRLVKVLLNRRTDIRDPILAGFEAARMQLHAREARATPGLAVVHVPHEDDPHLDTFVVSGGLDDAIGWLRKLAGMGVTKVRYEVELPPAAREDGDEDAWADCLADRLDEPGVSFSCTICSSEEEWRLGLPEQTAD